MRSTRPGGHGTATGVRASADRRARRVALAVGGMWAAAVVVALAAALRSPVGGAGGLGDAGQLPLSLPWAFVVPRGADEVANAWSDGALGLANAALAYAALRRAVPLGPRPAGPRDSQGPRVPVCPATSGSRP